MAIGEDDIIVRISFKRIVLLFAAAIPHRVRLRGVPHLHIRPNGRALAPPDQICRQLTRPSHQLSSLPSRPFRVLRLRTAEPSITSSNPTVHLLPSPGLNHAAKPVLHRLHYGRFRHTRRIHGRDDIRGTRVFPAPRALWRILRPKACAATVRVPHAAGPAFRYQRASNQQGSPFDRPEA